MILHHLSKCRTESPDPPPYKVEPGVESLFYSSVRLLFNIVLGVRGRALIFHGWSNIFLPTAVCYAAPILLDAVELQLWSACRGIGCDLGLRGPFGNDGPSSAAQRQTPHRQNEPQIGKRVLWSSTFAKPYETLKLLRAENKNKKVCRKRGYQYCFKFHW